MFELPRLAEHRLLSVVPGMTEVRVISGSRLSGTEPADSDPFRDALPRRPLSRAALPLILVGACHGAGRALSRGRSTHVDEAAYRGAMERLRVINPIDRDSPEVRRRPDILEAYHHRLKQETPDACKPITPVIQSVRDAGIARQCGTTSAVSCGLTTASVLA